MITKERMKKAIVKDGLKLFCDPERLLLFSPFFRFKLDRVVNFLAMY